MGFGYTGEVLSSLNSEDSNLGKDPRTLFKNVKHNILDEYNNPSYNLKLYLIPETTSSDADQDSTPEDNDKARSDENPYKVDDTTPNKNRGGYMNGAFRASKKDTIILSQTGVTGTVIRDMTIVQAVGSGDAGPQVQTVEMTLEQPGAANFPDQIIRAKEALGIRPKHYHETPFFLEINFQGYTEDIEDADAGGQVAHISGPYLYKLVLQTMKIEIDEKGSLYRMTFGVWDTYHGDNNAVYKLQENYKTTGATIEDHIQDLENKLNNAEQRNLDSDNTKGDGYGIADIVTLDTSKLIGSGEDQIKDSRLSKDFAETTTETTDEKAEANQETKTSEAQQKEEGKEAGSKEVEYTNQIINHTAGMTISEAILAILFRNDEFLEMVNPNNGSGEHKVSCALPDVKISSNVKIIEYDEKRKEYAKERVYSPYLSMSPSVSANTKETLDEDGNPNINALATLQKMQVKKMYEYIYTGRNDQILSLDIDYDWGVRLLLPPEDTLGRPYGTATFNNPAYFKSEPKKSDELLDPLKNLSDFIDNFKNGLTALKKLKDEPLKELGKLAGLGDGDIKQLIADRAGNVAKGLVQSLADRNINSALNNALKNVSQTGVATQSDNERQSLLDTYNNGEYSAGPSGYRYSEELLGMDGVSVFADDLNDAQEKIRDNVEAEKQRPKGGKFSSPYPKHEKEYVEGTAVLGAENPANNLFGYLASQRNGLDMLFRLDVTLRGDPFYLGSPSNTASTPTVDKPEEGLDERIKGLVDADNFFLFELRQPEYFDPNTDDEDNNTGMWPITNTSYFISGIYRIIQVQNEFSGGIFRSYVQATKEVAIDYSVLAQEGMTLEDYAEYWEDEKKRLEEGGFGHPFEDPNGNERFNDPKFVDKVFSNLGWDPNDPAIRERVLNFSTINSGQLDNYLTWKKAQTGNNPRPGGGG